MIDVWCPLVQNVLYIFAYIYIYTYMYVYIHIYIRRFGDFCTVINLFYAQPEDQTLFLVFIRTKFIRGIGWKHPKLRHYTKI